MLLQEAIEFDAYFRCYCLGGKYVRIMDYEPESAPPSLCGRPQSVPSTERANARPRAAN
jgi:hypothetical protein